MRLVAYAVVIAALAGQSRASVYFESALPTGGGPQPNHTISDVHYLGVRFLVNGFPDVTGVGYYDWGNNPGNTTFEAIVKLTGPTDVPDVLPPGPLGGDSVGV